MIFPDKAPDSSPGMLISALIVGLAIVGSAYHAGRRFKGKNMALKVGVVTSVIGFAIAMLTFIVVDNLFLDVVGKQADKLWGYQHSSYPSMRSYVNWGLLRGLLFGLPASAVFGLACGFIARWLTSGVHKFG